MGKMNMNHHFQPDDDMYMREDDESEMFSEDADEIEEDLAEVNQSPD